VFSATSVLNASHPSEPNRFITRVKLVAAGSSSKLPSGRLIATVVVHPSLWALSVEMRMQYSHLDTIAFRDAPVCVDRSWLRRSLVPSRSLASRPSTDALRGSLRSGPDEPTLTAGLLRLEGNEGPLTRTLSKARDQKENRCFRAFGISPFRSCW
jgi:hypothetical protein